MLCHPKKLLLLLVVLSTICQNVSGQKNLSLETILKLYFSNVTSFDVSNLPIPPQNIQINYQDIKELNNECGRQLFQLYDGLEHKQIWAYSMLDAAAKPQSGILQGNIMHIGNFDECLKIKHKNGSEIIKGKYCAASYMPHKKYGKDLQILLSAFLQNAQQLEDNFNIYLSYGICIPAACDSTTLNTIIDIFEEYRQSPIHFTIEDNMCHVQENFETIPTDLLCGIIIFGTVGIIIALSTLYDVFVYQTTVNSQNKKLLTVFSLYTNGRKAFQAETSADSLHCLNGIRVISMMWIILGHRFMSNGGLPHINTLSLIESLKNDDKYVIIMAGFLAVDTFLTVSAILIVYLFLKRKENKLSDIPMFYFHRILRLTPSLLMIIVFLLTILKYTGSGPFWSYFEIGVIEDCKTNWWKTLLYIQNYVDPEKMCISTSWYLAVDTQLYFLSPILLFPLLKWPKSVLCVTFLLAVASMAITAYVSWADKLGVLYLAGNKFLYYPTHTRAGPWLLGIICGYLLHITKDRKVQIPKFFVVLLWLISLSILCTVAYSLNYVWKNGLSNVDAAFYNATHKTGMSLGLCIMIFLCVNGHGGFINSFLSHKIFNILIRFNYNMYLVHMFVILYPLLQRRAADYFIFSDMMQGFWGDYVFSLAVAIIWTLSFESPIIAIEKIIFGKEKVTTSQSSQETLECDSKMNNLEYSNSNTA